MKLPGKIGFVVLEARSAFDLRLTNLHDPDEIDEP